MGGPPLLIQGNVGPATGAVRHPGDVKIDGSLLAGGKVQAGGDLHIAGNATSAAVEVSGSITVGGMVSGAGTVLDAIGGITVLQASDAKLVAGRDILVLSAAERCLLHAGGEILLAGAPGLLRGGIARAGNRLTAVRIETSGRIPARIEIGGQVFEEDPEEMEERLAFVRKQTVLAQLKSGESPEAYRLGLAGLRTYRKLAQTLDHRVRQMRVATQSGSPVLIVTGAEPVFVKLRMGPDALAVTPPSMGPFEFALNQDDSSVTSPKEVACEQ